MKTAAVKPNQTLYDLALEQYGTCEAVGELLALNPGLENDAAALVQRGIDPLADPAFYLDGALDPQSVVRIDDQSPLYDRSLLRELPAQITTYDYDTDPE